MAPTTRSSSTGSLERVPEDATVAARDESRGRTMAAKRGARGGGGGGGGGGGVVSCGKFAFPLLVVASFCLASWGYSLVGEVSGGRLAAVSRSQESGGEIAVLVGWRMLELGLAWFGGLRALDVAMLDLLAHGPLFYLQATFYSLGVKTAASALLVDVLSASLPFHLLRPPTNHHHSSPPDLQLHLYTTALASSIYTITIALSQRLLLPRILALHFRGLATLEPAYAASYTAVLPATAVFGAAAAAFIYVPSSTTTGDDAQALDPVTASLGETLRWNLWGYSSRTKLVVRRTCLVMLLVAGNTYLSCTRGLYGVEAHGALVYAAVWVGAAACTGLALGLVGGV
ncbi:hypothetical protein GQ602_004471 [Ophiocordyceps camponoti-floridani]|uniref:Uncharacterized protein n=1 Tax=Ophiocordyceps camponoti-floridani TaxID=2030778 RepID=A0A8H4Q6Z0_9HYPO|nr:hypothetical protein GQ602_004471 [Ophiocordyceps camponoti-floridani]